ncbi:hypothetical protein [Azospira restricta]|uniref:Uncharacterized protein n=1 Tax=Azospira restricta TaxID=404405 RepID=A0A974SN07_9RHOO|nr:hypothetical protein [Azospira restricta]QRJ63205.1 hypothetical protein IWH25_15850 [Azospira restricta]
MQALLSFEQAPPMAAPFRFFLTAPLFALLAGAVLLVGGGDAFASRWSPGALALTHLIAVGFVLQVMLGALIQILPVVAGANLAGPLWVARLVHALLVPGALCLVAGFLGLFPGFAPAAVLLVAGVGLFVVAAARALLGVPSTSHTIGGLKVALASLAVVVGLGVALAGGLEARWSLPLVDTTHVHAGWGLGAWGVGLLSAVAYVVVPMFQLTPLYPRWFSRAFGGVLFAAATLLAAATLSGRAVAGELLQALLVWLAAAFCAMTLWLQARSKRARPDATQRLWRGGLLCGLAACLLWALAALVPAIGERDEWPLLFGVLVLAGGYMSVVVGMLYKIVPFLVWLHLQNRGRGKVTAPNMKAVLAEPPMQRQMRVHFAACALLAAAVLWPAWLARPAGLALALSAALLAANLFAALGVYRRHAALVDRRLAELAGGRA